MSLSPAEMIIRVKESNWHLQLEHESGFGIEFTLLSGLDSLKRILQFLKHGFSYGNVDRGNWAVHIIRGQELLEVSRLEDLNDQVIKRKWPDCDNHNASKSVPFFPEYYNRVGGKKEPIREGSSNIKNLSRLFDGNEKELELILEQVFAQKD